VIARRLGGVVAALLLTACPAKEKESLVVVGLGAQGALPAGTVVRFTTRWGTGSSTKSLTLKKTLTADAVLIGLYLPAQATGPLMVEGEADLGGGCSYHDAAMVTLTAAGATTAPVPLQLRPTAACQAAPPSPVDGGPPDAGGDRGADAAGDTAAAADAGPDTAPPPDPPNLGVACKVLVHHDPAPDCPAAMAADFAVNAVDFSGDGTLVATGANDSLVIWSVTPAGLVRAQSVSSFRVTTAAFSPDSAWLGYGTEATNLLLERLATKAVSIFGQGSLVATQRLAFASDSDRVATITVRANRVNLYSISKDTLTARIEFGATRLRDLVSAGGAWFAVATEEQKVVLANVDAVFPVPGPSFAVDTTRPDSPITLAMASDGVTLAVGSDAGIVFWDLSDKTAPKKSPTPALAVPGATVTSMAFSPFRRHLLVATTDAAGASQLALYALDTQKVAGEPRKLPYRSGRVAFSPDGRATAAALDGCGQFLYCR
jgi:WD40 repeat protein